MGGFFVFDPGSVKRLREGLGIGISEFADRIGVSKQAIHMIEKGRRPSVRILELMMAKFGADPAAFFSRRENKRAD